MLRLAFDFIITWRETRTRPNAYAHAYLPLQIGVAFEAGSPSACLCQYAHATILHAEKVYCLLVYHCL